MEHSEQVDLIVAKAHLLNDHGVLLGENMWPLDDVVALHDQAIQLLVNQSAEVVAAKAIRYELARGHDLVGSILFRSDLADLGFADSDGPPGAGPPPGAPGGRWNPLPGKPKPKPDSPQWENELGPPDPAGLGKRLGRPGRPAGPPGFGGKDLAQFNENHLTQARDTLTSLLAEEPDNSQFRLLLAQVERHRLVHLLRSSMRDDAGDAFRTARRILEKLVADFPQEPQYRLELADTLSLVSTRLTSISDEEAERDLNKAISYCQQLATAFPNVAQYQALLATSYRNLARVQQSTSNLKGAEENLSLAQEQLLSLATDHPAQPFYEIGLAFTVIELAAVKRRIGAG